MVFLYCTIVLVFGLVLGSFLNVCVLRTKEGKTFIKGRSHCPKCGQLIKWQDNLPILSFIFLKAKCRSCQQKISWQYPLVELAVGVLFVLVFLFERNSSWLLLRDLAVTWLLVFIFVYDLKYQEIWDQVTLIPAGVLFIISTFVSVFPSVSSMSIGVLIGSGFFLLQYLVSRGRWIGGGDVRLGVLMGVVLGWPNTLVALIISYILGALIGLFLLWKKKKELQDKMAFGTFLSLATFIIMMWGDVIVSWYTKLIF